ncbi:MAG: RNB domain-containing ribonuclease [Oligoflexia bacterium]|nr:RNB domain-containing ribonuclease [Oligoflexia bacterium]
MVPIKKSIKIWFLVSISILVLFAKTGSVLAKEQLLAIINDPEDQIVEKIEKIAKGVMKRGNKKSQESLKNQSKNLSENSGSNEQIMNEIQVKEKNMLSEGNSEKLKDLQHIPLITMDGDDSKDLDQALYLKKTRNGGYKVYYAIADASYFVEENTELDRQAKSKLSTTYLPHKSFPMLPRELSEGLTSINEGEPRRALVAIITLDKDGNKIKQKFTYAMVKSHKKTSYRAVQEFFDNKQSGDLANKEYTSALVALKEVGEKRIALSKKRGSIPFTGKEMRLVKKNNPLDKGSVWNIVMNDHYQTEEWNAQISIMVNNAVGEFIHDKKFKSLHRAQSSPEIERFVELCEKLINLDKNQERVNALCVEIKKMNRENIIQKLSEYVSKLDIENSEMDKILVSQVLSVNGRAEYSDENTFHDGLKINCYDQFTAPMRRYSDIVIHRIVKALLQGKEPPYQEKGALKQLAKNVNMSADKEKSIKREIDHFAHNLILKNNESKILTARVYSVGPDNVNVVFDNFPFQYRFKFKDIEGMNIGKQKNNRKQQQNFKQQSSVQQKFKIGDKVNINLLNVDPENDRVRIAIQSEG